MSVSLQLARLCLRPVDTQTQDRAGLHLLDWMGCAAIGSAQPMASALWKGSSITSISADLPDPCAPDPWHSLLFEGAIGNILEMDDIHRTALVHPGPVVIPAALFLARHLNSSGSELAQALVRGYEAMIRLGAAVGPGHYAYWHNTSTCGTLGAAAAAASLLNLTETQWCHAFGHALTQSAGLWQVRLDPCMSKQWHTAKAAQTGVQAALLARSGVTAAAHILEGAKGFFAAMCPDGRIQAILDAPNADWKIFDTSFKPWPACRHAHPAIDAALMLRKQLLTRYGSAAAEQLSGRIKQITIQSYADALAFCDRPQPDSPDQARFSLQHSVAITLLRGEPTLADFNLDAIAAPDCTVLRKKTTVCHDPRWDHVYPAHFGASLKVDMVDGAVFLAEVHDTRGDPESPMSRTNIIEKAHALMHAAHWPEGDISKRTSACLSLSTLITCMQEIAPIPAPAY